MPLFPPPWLPIERDSSGPPRSGRRFPWRPPAQAAVLPGVLVLAVGAVLGLPFPAATPTDPHGPPPESPERSGTLRTGFVRTAAEMLARQKAPLWIVYQGSGVHTPGDPAPPAPNPVTAVRHAFEGGAAGVGIQVHMAADGETVVWHDDVLPDGSCLDTLTRAELLERAPAAYGFPAVLEAAQRFNRAEAPGHRGLLAVELRPASSVCDPRGDGERDRALVEGVISVVREMGGSDLVFLSSTSPFLLALAAEAAPEVPRQLSLRFFQFLDPAQAADLTGLSVTTVSGLGATPGLQWWELGGVHRFPAYRSTREALATARGTGSAIVSLELTLLEHLERAMPGAAASLVATAREMGFVVLASSVSGPAQWHLGALLGVDGLYVEDLPLALRLRDGME